VQATIKAIEYHLPSDRLTNEDLALKFPDWPATKIEEKTGIRERHIASLGECSSDLAVRAAEKLFARESCSPQDIDYLLFCTQTPDYFLPTTACLLQDRLHLKNSCGALDFNLGCSGFVYGLGLAKGLIETGQAHNILLITAETYSKLIHPADKSVRTVFGDGAAATLIGTIENEPGSLESAIGPIVVGTDGSGANNLIVRAGGLRQLWHAQSGDSPGPEHLYMNGAEVYTFTLRTIPAVLDELLLRAGKSMEDVDFFIFHQANRYILENLRKKVKIPEDRFYVDMTFCGNTVSSTIPIALKEASGKGLIKKGQCLAVLGFGVGYSWAGALLKWPGI
jgi:3-oxoacyl-[acyl-carrier-protein] synthase-3